MCVGWHAQGRILKASRAHLEQPFRGSEEDTGARRGESPPAGIHTGGIVRKLEGIPENVRGRQRLWKEGEDEGGSEMPGCWAGRGVGRSFK